jgi:predicted small secreted protein
MMKKTIALIIAITVVAWGLSGCGGGSGEDQQETQATTQAAMTDQQQRDVSTALGNIATQYQQQADTLKRNSADNQLLLH